MSKKMTPCEKLGYKVGDKFTVIKDSYFEKGTIVVLSEDDGSEVPWFTCGSVRRALIIGSNPDVEPAPSKLKPAKQALADAINQNGGWRSGANWACQHGLNRVVVFSASGLAPTRNAARGMACWNSGAIFFGGFQFDRKLPNWHQCVLSRDEYYQAYPKADEDGWIEWKGGECPVSGDDIVDVAYSTYGAKLFSAAANSLRWSKRGPGGDIIAYRLHKQEAKPEFCESVTHGIPEPESIDGLCAKVTEENKHQHVDAKPTIEQLAQDYRNAKDYALRLQKEAGEAAVKAESFAVEIRKKILELQELIG